MNVNYIFGITSKLVTTADIIKRGFITDAPQGNIPTGTPCLIFSSTTNKLVKKVLIPFASSNKNGRPRLLINRKDGSSVVTKTLEDTNFLDTIETVKTSKIRTKDLNNIIQRVQNTGPVTFLIDSSKNLNRDIIKTLSLLSGTFDVRALLHSKRNGKHDLLDGEQLLLAFTLIDMKCCIPIFDPRKVNGVILHLTAYYPLRSQTHDQLVNSFETTLLFSKYTENLTEIDGTNLNFSTTSIESIKNILRENASYINDVGLKGLKGQKEKVSNDNISKKSNLFATTCSASTYVTYSGSTSSSAGFSDNF